MGMRVDQKIVIVTRATQLASLKRKFSTRSQAKFQIVSAKRRELAREGAAAALVEERAAAAFDEVDQADAVYDQAVELIRRDLDAANLEIPIQTIDREFVPNFLFGPRDVVITVGQDGLVANTAKYVLERPIIAINPDPKRIDGVLLPFQAQEARSVVRDALRGTARIREVTLAQATLDNGQSLLGFNELFIGNRSHASARYRLGVAERSEPQSSSGLLVCTGAGSTGWLSSIFNMASRVASAFGAEQLDTKKAPPSPSVTPVHMPWEDPRLVYVVREPFVSRTSRADNVAGMLQPGRELIIESQMPGDGVVFSDGVEADFLEFNSGAIARVATAPRHAHIVVPRSH